MIDFRYHLVSLVSVFLALALGVVLGAGPLSGPIGDALTSEVDKMRIENTQLRKEIESTRSAVAQREKFIKALEPQLVTGVLPEINVALVQLPGAQSQDVKALSETLTRAGAKISANVKIENNWIDNDKIKFREALASQLTSYLASPPPAGASTDQILGATLAQLLNQGSNDTLVGILASKTDALISFDSPITSTARSIVIVGPRGQRPEEEEENEEVTTKNYNEQMLILAQTLARSPGGALVVGSANTETDLVAFLRARGSGVSTVDSLGSLSSEMIVPTALVNTLNGTLGDWGLQTGASAVLPNRVLPEAPPAPPAAQDSSTSPAPAAPAGQPASPAPAPNPAPGQ